MTTGEAPTCLNCGTTLSGQYCGQCGQRASSRLISLWELIRDAFGDLFELDSRLWRTLLPLLVRPGLLTRDYLEGRRARYMPPFRMYLVLSLIFFLVAFFNPRSDLAILFEEPTEAELAAEAEAEALEKRQNIEETRKELEELNITIDGDDGDVFCDKAEVGEMPEFLKRRLTEARVKQACEHWRTVGAEGFVAAVRDNIPAALIVLLPIMALVLKFLYPLSRRYYGEHLLFFVHFHSFCFLLLTLQILWVRLITLTPLHGAVAQVSIVALSFYIPVYVHQAMRRVYGQGGLFTFLKFLVLSAAYLIGFALVMVGALLIAAFSV